MADKRFARHILRKVFLEDWGLKLLALFITLALWLGITGLSTHSRRNMTISLNTIVANDSTLTNSPREQIEVVLSGDKRRFEQLNPGEISATLDLTELPPGDWVMPLRPDTITINNLPQGITLDEVRPGNMAVKLDTVVERDVVVRVDSTGSVAAGFEVYSTTITPSRIRVRGPATLMRLVEYVQTDKIDLTGKREDFTVRQIAVNSPDPKAAVLATVVDVEFTIGEKRIERSFAVTVAGEPGKSASFTIFAPTTALRDAKADDFRVEVYLDDNGELKPRLTLPPALNALSEIRNLRFR